MKHLAIHGPAHLEYLIEDPDLHTVNILVRAPAGLFTVEGTDPDFDGTDLRITDADTGHRFQIPFANVQGFKKLD